MENESVIERLRREGLLIRNEGVNSIKSFKNIISEETNPILSSIDSSLKSILIEVGQINSTTRKAFDFQVETYKDMLRKERLGYDSRPQEQPTPQPPEPVVMPRSVESGGFALGGVLTGLLGGIGLRGIGAGAIALTGGFVRGLGRAGLGAALGYFASNLITDLLSDEQLQEQVTTIVGNEISTEEWITGTLVASGAVAMLAGPFAGLLAAISGAAVLAMSRLQDWVNRNREERISEAVAEFERRVEQIGEGGPEGNTILDTVFNRLGFNIQDPESMSTAAVIDELNASLSAISRQQEAATGVVDEFYGMPGSGTEGRTFGTTPINPTQLSEENLQSYQDAVAALDYLQTQYADEMSGWDRRVLEDMRQTATLLGDTGLVGMIDNIIALQEAVSAPVPLPLTPEITAAETSYMVMPGVTASESGALAISNVPEWRRALSLRPNQTRSSTETSTVTNGVYAVIPGISASDSGALEVLNIPDWRRAISLRPRPIAEPTAEFARSFTEDSLAFLQAMRASDWAEAFRILEDSPAISDSINGPTQDYVISRYMRLMEQGIAGSGNVAIVPQTAPIVNNTDASVNTTNTTTIITTDPSSFSLDPSVYGP